MVCNGILTTALFAAFFVFPPSSSASTQHANDGGFCTSKGYLAFDDLEFTEGKGGGVEPHLLKIFRFGTGHGVYFAGQMTLPERLVVSRIVCRTDHVELGTRIYPDPSPKRCIIDVATTSVMGGSAECDDDPAESLLQLGEPQVLWGFAPDAATIPLESDDSEHQYQLRRHFSQRIATGGLESHIKCEIVKIDKKGTIIQRLVIYDYRKMSYAD